jgi:hypothetical protein
LAPSCAEAAGEKRRRKRRSTYLMVISLVVNFHSRVRRRRANSGGHFGVPAQVGTRGCRIHPLGAEALPLALA